MTSVSHSNTLPLVKLPFLGSDKINRDLDMFTDQLLPQEFPRFVGVEGLFRIGLSGESESRPYEQKRNNALWRPRRAQLHPPLLSILIHDTQLVSTPHPDHRPIQGLWAPARRMTVRPRGRYRQVCIQTKFLLLGHFLSGPETLHATRAGKHAGVPVNDTSETSGDEVLGDVSYGVDNCGASKAISNFPGNTGDSRIYRFRSRSSLGREHWMNRLGTGWRWIAVRREGSLGRVAGAISSR